MNANNNPLNTNTLNTFYHRLKQTSGNHKPHRHRKSQGTDEEIIAKMKMKMALRKAQEKHKRVISQARKRRGAIGTIECDHEEVVLNEKPDDETKYDDFAYMDPEMMGL